MFDVVIVGGSNAGLSAALVLGRARRQVLVLDHQQPRNAPAPGVHNFLSRDGILPAELRRIGREQLRPYESVEVRFAEATAARRTAGGFEVTLDDTTRVQTRRLVLATGVVDELPPIPGMAELWGTSVFHCPYCHGWEVRDEPLAVYGNGTIGLHLIKMLRGWSRDLVLCTDGPATLTHEERQQLAAHHIDVREEKITALRARDGRLQQIVFASGAPLARHALLIHPHQHQRSDLAAQLGCEVVGDGQFPTLIKVDAMGQSSVPGVYVAGDAMLPRQGALSAAASGMLAAVALNNDMLFQEFDREAA